MILTERQMMRKLTEAQRVLGPRFSRDNFRTLHGEGFPKEYAYRKLFGSWGRTVIELHKMEPTLEKDPKVQILMYMHKAKNILGSSFNRDTYRILKGFPTEYQIKKTFGSWTNAVQIMNNL